ncbi:MAG TPA: hypothetical protein VGB76_02960, partial [Pyrinomonadaceae bacterium]
MSHTRACADQPASLLDQNIHAIPELARTGEESSGITGRRRPEALRPIANDRRLSPAANAVAIIQAMSGEASGNLRLMIVAGEASGDAHAASLVRALRESAPGVRFQFFGATGREMRAAGVESVVATDDLAITGLMEIGRALKKFWRAYQTLRRVGIERAPQAVILVDWPDFNLRLARFFHRRGLRVIYYISPQLWAWREHRARNIRRDVDLLLAILPFEPS